MLPYPTANVFTTSLDEFRTYSPADQSRIAWMRLSPMVFDPNWVPNPHELPVDLAEEFLRIVESEAEAIKNAPAEKGGAHDA